MTITASISGDAAVGAQRPSVADVLIEARKLIEKPENWAQGYYAYDEAGGQVEPNAASAARFCMIGACCSVLGREDDDELRPYWSAFISLVGRDVVSFNDSKDRTHAEVLAAFDRAIAKATGAAS